VIYSDDSGALSRYSPIERELKEDWNKSMKNPLGFKDFGLKERITLLNTYCLLHEYFKP
jgi:hypothetical protein